jgi:hypothetical protein
LDLISSFCYLVWVWVSAVTWGYGSLKEILLSNKNNSIKTFIFISITY